MDGVKLRANIEEVPIDEIIPYENNPRINDRAVPALVESIKMVGFNVPLVLDGNNVVICGHTRLKAAEFRRKERPTPQRRDNSFSCPSGR